MPTRAVAVRHVREDDWELLRQVRLSALAADPGAFGSTLAHEERADADAWREWIRRSAWFVAEAGGRALGVVALNPVPDAPGRFEVTAVWVDPVARGAGVADTLMLAVVSEARARQASELSLFVVDGNTIAEQLYRRHRFVRTGRTKALPHTPGVIEVEMRLDLA